MVKRETENKSLISWSVEQDIGFLVLDNPPGNSMTALFFDELKMLTKAIPQSNIKALIIAGRGRHFSSGTDLESLIATIRTESTGNGKSIKDAKELLLSNVRSFEFFSHLNIPVIAAIQGVCLGSALELAMHCHFRLCAGNALLGLPETGFALIPGVRGIQKTAELAGRAKAIELILKGSNFAATDAYKWHIVDVLFTRKELMEKARLLANIAANDYRRYKKKEYLKQLDQPVSRD